MAARLRHVDPVLKKPEGASIAAGLAAPTPAVPPG